MPCMSAWLRRSVGSPGVLARACRQPVECCPPAVNGCAASGTVDLGSGLCGGSARCRDPCVWYNC